jgi:hypothetical protein
MDLAALAAESSWQPGPDFGRTIHPTIPAAFAPPDLLGPLAAFLSEHPFDRNVFGMTRFPDEQDSGDRDPMPATLAVARAACRDHGLEFHLASDRAMVDDLWANVTAHMWGSRYGIGVFEDRRGRGLNYNLVTEIGGMLVTGRRCALLKDQSIDRMPTDLIGKIYRSVDLDVESQVSEALHSWMRNDLSLGRCENCA